mgnify:CR=1 FL=1
MQGRILHRDNHRSKRLMMKIDVWSFSVSICRLSEDSPSDWTDRIHLCGLRLVVWSRLVNCRFFVLRMTHLFFCVFPLFLSDHPSGNKGSSRNQDDSCNARCHNQHNSPCLSSVFFDNNYRGCLILLLNGLIEFGCVDWSCISWLWTNIAKARSS